MKVEFEVALEIFFKKISSVTGDKRIYTAFSVVDVASIKEKIEYAIVNNEHFMTSFFSFDINFLTMIETEQIIPYIKFTSIKESSSAIMEMATLDIFLCFCDILCSLDNIQEFANGFHPSDISIFYDKINDRRKKVIESLQLTSKDNNNLIDTNQDTKTNSSETPNIFNDQMMDEFFTNFLGKESSDKMKANPFLGAMKDTLKNVDFESLQKDFNESGIDMNNMNPMDIVKPLMNSFLSGENKNENNNIGETTGIEKIFESVKKNVNLDAILNNTFSKTNEKDNNEKDYDDDKKETPAFKQEDVMNCLETVINSFQSKENIANIFQKAGIDNNNGNIEMITKVTSFLPILMNMMKSSSHKKTTPEGTQEGQGEENQNTNFNIKDMINSAMSQTNATNSTNGTNDANNISNLLGLIDEKDIYKMIDIYSKCMNENDGRDPTEKAITNVVQFLINKNRTKSKKQVEKEEEERLRSMDPDVPIIKKGEFDEMEEYFSSSAQPELD